MEPKYLFGSICVIILGVIQISAFILGVDGQVLAFTTAGITGLITFLLGINITSPATKTAIHESISEILDHYKKPPKS